MKTVFSTREVIHVWASQDQETGRNSNNTVYFDGRTIYSYGGHFPMAHIWDKDSNVVFVNTASYSNTTSKHQCWVRGAIQHKRKIFVPECAINGKGYDHNHKVNLQYFLGQIELNVRKHKNARKYSYLSEIGGYLSSLNEYVEMFRIKRLLTKVEKELLTKKAEDLFETKFIQAREVRIKKQNAEKIRKAQVALNEWAGCELKYVEDKVYLRTHGDDIQTSMGASVPVREAKILYGRIKAGKDIKGMKIGYYTVISMNGILKIGCHNITRDEMDRLATLMSW